jgi:hypothetical protein
MSDLVDFAKPVEDQLANANRQPKSIASNQDTDSTGQRAVVQKWLGLLPVTGPLNERSYVTTTPN